MNNTANILYTIIGISTVVILWTHHNKRNKETINELEAKYQMDMKGDSVIYKRNLPQNDSLQWQN